MLARSNIRFYQYNATRMWEFVVYCLYVLAHDKQSSSNKLCVCKFIILSFIVAGDSLPLSFYVICIYVLILTFDDDVKSNMRRLTMRWCDDGTTSRQVSKKSLFKQFHFFLLIRHVQHYILHAFSCHVLHDFLVQEHEIMKYY